MRCFKQILFASAAISALGLSVASAQEAARASSTSDDTNLVETVVVTGEYQFLSADTKGTTNLPLQIEKVPQSISLVTSDFIKAADLKTLGDIADYTPGALSVGVAPTQGWAIKLRGFVPGVAIDGVNVLQSFFDNDPDHAIYDRIEIVKGPSSVVYGVSSPGGLINMVTKSANPDTPSYIHAEVGSWDSYRLEGQVAGSLTSDGTVRAIGVAVQDIGNSFIDHVRHNKSTLYGGIDADLSSKITASLHGGMQHFGRTTFEGVPGFADGTPAPVPRSFFIGSANQRSYTESYHAEAALNWQATDMLDVSLKGNYAAGNLTGLTNYATNLKPDGTMSIGMVNDVAVWNKNFGVGGSAVYHFDDIGLEKSFVSFGVLYQSNHQPIYELYPDNGTANLFSGEDAISREIELLQTAPQNVFERDIKLSTLTLSGQAFIQIADPLSVLLGVSYSKPDGEQVVNGVHQASVNDPQTSLRGAVTYEFLPGANAYVSFSQSFVPQTVPSLKSGILPPLSGEQTEAGIKYRSEDGRLLLTGAVYRIGENNARQYDKTVANIDYYIGTRVIHKGVELQAVGEITPQWQINLGYTYLYTRINNPTRPNEDGRSELYLPANTVSAFSTYTLDEGALRGLTFGGGVRHVGSMHTSFPTAVSRTKDLPGYVVVDATLGYAFEDWTVQLNAKNIFNALYYYNVSSRVTYGNRAGEPGNLTLAIRRKF